MKAKHVATDTRISKSMLVLATVSLAFFAVQCKKDQTASVTVSDATYSGDSYSNVRISFYDGSAFQSYCPSPVYQGQALPPSQGIAVSEGMFGLVCEDNWIKIDPYNVEDVEDNADPGRGNDIRDANKKGWGIKDKWDYIVKAKDACLAKDKNMPCVREQNGVWEYNKPTCYFPGRHDACDPNNVFEMTISNNRGLGREIVYLNSQCPKKHWKNLAKWAFGVDDQILCAGTHIDISDKLLGKLGLATATQHQTFVDIRKLSENEKDSASPNQEVQRSSPDTKQSQKAANGYPYCTNGSNNGDGYGYDQAVTDPKGSHSCVVRGGSADTGNKPSNQGASTGGNAANGFPYCTNGSSTSGGFGYDENVIDPNGGHSCVVPGGGADTGSASATKKASNGYPYCTNGSDNGDGYGYDESVIDPTGSHSCVVYGG